MNEENTRKLFTDFDRLFRGRTEPGTQTRMCDGFTCGDGWFDLIYQLCVQITEYAQKIGLDLKAVQVKEKFGELRFYTKSDGEDEMLENMIGEAVQRSRSICEKCGAEGTKKRRDEWTCTICPQCEDRFAKKAKSLARLPRVPEFRINRIKRIKVIKNRRAKKFSVDEEEPPF